MTRNESFKRRIRARMAETGERYGAARRVLIERAARDAGRTWADDPGHSDEAIRAATGRTWDEWADLIDAWPGRDDGHGAIAGFVRDDHGVEGWWAQTVTVGYERITGRRRRHQRPDGTYETSTSRTIVGDAGALRELLLDEDARADLFPGLTTQLRSRPTTRDVRLGIDGGTVLFHLEPHPDGRRVRATVAHGKLTDPDEVPRWKAFWVDWLEALDDA
jgi:hypothetical protein